MRGGKYIRKTVFIRGDLKAIKILEKVYIDSLKNTVQSIFYLTII